jgi:hypothetical protein
MKYVLFEVQEESIDFKKHMEEFATCVYLFDVNRDLRIEVVARIVERLEKFMTVEKNIRKGYTATFDSGLSLRQLTIIEKVMDWWIGAGKWLHTVYVDRRDNGIDRYKMVKKNRIKLNVNWKDWQLFLPFADELTMQQMDELIQIKKHLSHNLMNVKRFEEYLLFLLLYN